MNNIDSNKIITSLLIAVFLGSVTITASWAVAAYKFKALEIRVGETETESEHTNTRIDTIAIINCNWAIKNKVENAEKLCFKILKR